MAMARRAHAPAKGSPMPPPFPSIARFVAKLNRRHPLPDAGTAALLALPAERHSHAAFHDILREGERPVRCAMVEEGLVSRHRILRDGARQILSFHMPGDMIDLQMLLMPALDHSIHAHTAAVTVSVAQGDLQAVADRHPAVAQALWFDTLVDAGISREWTVNVGRRSAQERTAHLLLEFASRLDAAGGLVDGSFELPVTQAGLADALGLTHVHTNRMIQWLRTQRYIRTVGRMITIENWEEMRKLSGFDPGYLFPEGPRAMPADAD